MRKIDLFVPLLTGDPTTKAVDIVRDILGASAANRQSMSEDQGPDQVIRESYITLIPSIPFGAEAWRCNSELTPIQNNSDLPQAPRLGGATPS